MATFSVLKLDIDLRLDQQQLNKPEMFNCLNELKMKNKLPFDIPTIIVFYQHGILYHIHILSCDDIIYMIST